MITREKLNEIIESHGKWLRDEKGGKRADLRGAVLRDADLRGAVLRGADLRDAVLRYAVLRDAVLRGADLRGAVLRGAVLRDADLRDAVLRGADLRGAVLRGAVLRDADLRGAVLRGADLRGAVLRGAVLRDADLSYADLSYADLSYAVYQVSRIGCRKGTTTYNATLDNVQCGCWGNYRGGTLAEFIVRIKSVYGENGSNPNQQYYDEYMAAVDFFLAMKKLGDKHD